MLGSENVQFSRFRIKKGSVEVEFEGPTNETLKRFDKIFEWAQKATVEPEVGRELGVKEVPERKKQKSVRRTGELKAIKERLLILKNEGFFDNPKELGEIRKEMRIRGWYHTAPYIQATLLKYEDLGIKRIEEQGRYKYVKV